MKTLLLLAALMLTTSIFSQSGFYYSEQNTQMIQTQLMKNKNFNQMTNKISKKEKQQLTRIFGMANSTSDKEAINLASILMKAMVIHGSITKKEMSQSMKILTNISNGKNVNSEFQMMVEENPSGFVAAIFEPSSPAPTGQGFWQGIRRAINRIVGAWIGNNVGGGWGFLKGGYVGMLEGGISGTSKGVEVADQFSDMIDGLENGGGGSYKPGPNGEDCTDPRGWPANQ